MPGVLIPNRFTIALILACGLTVGAQAQSDFIPSDMLLSTEPDIDMPRIDFPLPDARATTAMTKAVPIGAHSQREYKPSHKADRAEPSAPRAMPDPAPAKPAGGELGAAPPQNITATGRTMPPIGGRSSAGILNAATQAELLKTQKQAESRNKAWDSKMKKTMGSICSGC